jgi:hypothetical protein
MCTQRSVAPDATRSASGENAKVYTMAVCLARVCLQVAVVGSHSLTVESNEALQKLSAIKYGQQGSRNAADTHVPMTGGLDGLAEPSPAGAHFMEYTAFL